MTYDHSSTQIDLPPELADAVRAAAARLPDADLADGGRTDRPHITLLYGLHTLDPAPVRAALWGQAPARLSFGPLAVFSSQETGEPYEVLVQTVESPDLQRLHALLAGSLGHTATHAIYQPHVSVAYLKPGAGAKALGPGPLAGKSMVADVVMFSPPTGVPDPVPLGLEREAGRVMPSVSAAASVTKDGLPAASYLVVGDPQHTTTWHLKVKDADGTPNHGLMGAAWAALTHPHGSRGNPYEGPDKGPALAKLRALYKAQGWPTPGSAEAASEPSPGDLHVNTFLPGAAAPKSKAKRDPMLVRLLARLRERFRERGLVRADEFEAMVRHSAAHKAGVTRGEQRASGSQGGEPADADDDASVPASKTAAAPAFSPGGLPNALQPGGRQDDEDEDEDEDEEGDSEDDEKAPDDDEEEADDEETEDEEDDAARVRAHEGSPAATPPASFVRAYADPLRSARGDRFRLLLPLTFSVVGGREPPEWINYLPTPGTYLHPVYGEIDITPARNKDMVTQFNLGVYQKGPDGGPAIAIDAEHETKLSGAFGWIRQMRLNADGGADARVEWTDRGRQALAEKRFLFFSPEWYDEWTSPATGERFSHVAIGGALTTRPFFKSNAGKEALRPLVASEGGIYVPGEDNSPLQPLARTLDAPRGQEGTTMVTDDAPDGAASRAAQDQNQNNHTEDQMTSLQAREPATTTQQAAPAAPETGPTVQASERRFAEMEAENSRLRAMNEQNAAEAKRAAEDARMANERVTAMETATRLRSYAEMAHGWHGAPTEEFVSFMESEVKTPQGLEWFQTLMGAYSQQIKAAGLFTERGRPGQTVVVDPQERLDARVRQVMAEKSMNYREAASVVMAEDPALIQESKRASEVRAS